MAPPDPSPLAVPKTGDRVLTGLAIVVGLLLFFSLYAPRFTARPIDPAKSAPYRIDLNVADRNELMQVPGIGPSRADAIIAKRNELGSFGNVGDIAKVKGIGTKTVDGITSYVIVDGDHNPPSVPPAGKLKPGDPPIDINTCGEADLTRLPAIGPTMAARIIAARPFASVEDLRRVKGIGVKTFEGLKAWVVVNK